MGCDGIIVDMACLYTNWGLSVASQKHTKIVKPSQHALELYAIHQKDGDGNFLLPYVI